MPRYFFHLEDHPSDPDPEGTDLVDVNGARREALHYAAELLKTLEPDHLIRHGPVLVRVVDDEGRDVAAIEVRDRLAADR
jgi:hypothetical protein